MARNGQNNAANGTAVAPDAARQTYIDSLKAQHTAAMEEIETGQGQMTALETALAASRQRVQETADTLRQLGEKVSGGTVRRGRPAGSGRKAGPGRGVPGRVRPRNDSSLDQTVINFMGKSKAGTQFTVPQITEGVMATGYKTSSARPSILFSQSFSRLIEAKAAKRVGRGLYVLTERGRQAVA